MKHLIAIIVCLPWYVVSLNALASASCGLYDSSKVVAEPARCSQIIDGNIDWSYCDLSFKDLSNYDLKGANLLGANLNATLLIGTNLEYANLAGANLRGAIIGDTQLHHADFTGADLRSVSSTGKNDYSYAWSTTFENTCFTGSPDDISIRTNFDGLIKTDQPLLEQLSIAQVEQSSTNHANHAFYAIDDDPSTFAETAGEEGNWFMLDLGDSHFISTLLLDKVDESQRYHILASSLRNINLKDHNNLANDYKWVVSSEASEVEINTTARFLWIKSEQPIKLNEVSVKGDNLIAVPSVVSEYDFSFTSAERGFELLQKQRFYFSNDSEIFNGVNLQQYEGSLNKISYTLTLINAVDATLNTTCKKSYTINKFRKKIPPIGPLKALRSRVKQFNIATLKKCEESQGKFEKKIRPVYDKFNTAVTAANALLLIDKHTSAQQQLSALARMELVSKTLLYGIGSNEQDAEVNDASINMLLAETEWENTIETYHRKATEQYAIIEPNVAALTSLNVPLQSAKSALDKVNNLLRYTEPPLKAINAVLSKTMCVDLLFGELCFSLADILDGLSKVPFLSTFNDWADRIIDPLLSIVTSQLGNALPSFNLDISMPDFSLDYPAYPTVNVETSEFVTLKQLEQWHFTYQLPTDEDFDHDTLLNSDELYAGTGFYYTSPYNSDTDNDGMPDDFEQTTEFLDPTISQGVEDYDNDGLNNAFEYQIGTALDKADTDGDGLDDLIEYTYRNVPTDSDSGIITGLDPLNANDAGADFDQDGLLNSEEIGVTSLFKADADGDGLNDKAELDNGTNPENNDTDNDKLTDLFEVTHGFSPTVVGETIRDTDGDHVTNVQEQYIGTNPVSAIDSDGDNLPDDWELFWLGDLLSNDTDDNDNDGFTNIQEFQHQTSPMIVNGYSGIKSGYFYNDSFSGERVTNQWSDIQISGSYTPFSLLSENDEELYKPIGFNFIFFGKTYSRVKLLPSGQLSFLKDDKYYCSYSAACIKAMSVGGVDFERSGVYIKTYADDSATEVSEQYTVFQFQIFQKNMTVAQEFQVKLHQHENRIEIQYKQTLDADPDGGLPTPRILSGDTRSVALSPDDKVLSGTRSSAEFYSLLSIGVDASSGISAGAGETKTHTITISNSSNTTINFDVSTVPGPHWTSRLSTNQIAVASHSINTFEVDVDIPTNTIFDDPTDQLYSDELFLHFSDPVNQMQAYVAVTTENHDFDLQYNPLNVSAAESYYNRTHTHGLLNGQSYDFTWFVSQGEGFGWPQQLSTESGVRQVHLSNISESVSGVEWLYGDSLLSFVLRPSEVYELLSVGITSGLVDYPTIGIEIPTPTNGMVVYRYNANAELVPLSSDLWQVYEYTVDYLESADGCSVEIVPFDQCPNRSLLLPLFVDGSEHDFDGVENDRVVYKIAFGQLDDVPLLVEDNYQLQRNEHFHVDASQGLLANDSNIAFGSNIEIIKQPLNGTLTVNNDGSFSYKHHGTLSDENWNQKSDSFIYRVVDNRAYIKPVEVSLTIIQAPVLGDNLPDSLTMQEDGFGSLVLTASDNNGSISEWRIAQPSLLGQLSITNIDDNSAQLQFTANENANGIESVVVEVIDADNNVTEYTFNIVIEAINDAPSAQSDSYQLLRGQPLSIGQNSGLLANDVDAEEQHLTIEILEAPEFGELTISEDGSFSYVHAGDYGHELDTFSYQLFDGELYSNEAAVDISITDDITTARAFDDFYSLSEGGTLEISVSDGILSNDDMAGEIVLLTDPTSGELTLQNDGSLIYIHDGSENSTPHFSYKLRQSTSEQSEAIVRFDIEDVNDAPVIDSSLLFPLVSRSETISPSTGPLIKTVYGWNQTLDFTLSASDAEEHNLTWDTEIYRIDGGVQAGILTLVAQDDIASSMTYRYQPPTGILGKIGIRITVEDELGTNSEFVFEIEVFPPNEIPLAAPETFAINSGEQFEFSADELLVNDSDADGDALSIIVVELPLYGELHSDNGIDYTYRHNGSGGNDQIGYIVTDGKQSSDLVYAEIVVNGAPYFLTEGVLTTNNDVNYSYYYLIGVYDDQSVVLSSANSVIPPWLTINKLGTNRWSLSGNSINVAPGFYPVKLQISDGTFQRTQSFTIKVVSAEDRDSDNDGVNDNVDAFPFDETESIDTDADGIGNNVDTDDDNDGVVDASDTFPLDETESIDTDADGIGNNVDTDDDNDGVNDDVDAFPLDKTESVDTDADGIGNNVDTDDDNDGTPDELDVAPLDKNNSQIDPRIPEVSIVSSALSEPNGLAGLKLQLSKEAHSYPVVVSGILNIDGQYVNDVNTRIENGLTGDLNVSIPDGIEESSTVIVMLTEAQNALLSEKKSTDITVTSANIAPILTLQIMQNDDPVAAIEQDGGIVTVRAQIVDINAADKHSLSWQKIDVQDLDRDDNALTIEFNPEDMPIGVYSFIAKVEELNTDKRLSAQVSINFVVVEAGTLSEAQDSDGDGRTDLEEGFGDIDLDNIPDYLDNDADTSRVPISSDSSITMLSTGSLKLGQYIIASKAEQSRYASFTPENLMEIVSEGDMSPAIEDYRLKSPIYNFVIADLLQAGDIATFVLTLDTALDENVIYRKYSPSLGWYDFVEDDRNAVYSSELKEDECSLEETEYTSGLNQGARCVLLKIEDGGANDIDGLTNSQIEDPGAFMVIEANQAPVIVLTSNISAVLGEELIIDASNSYDPEGEPLIYQWHQISGETLMLEDTESARVTFTAPEQPTTVELLLILSDGVEVSEQTVLITINQVNRLPEVTFDNKAVKVNEGEEVSLSVIASDPDGDTLTYSWAVTSVHELSLNNTDSGTITFTAPAVDRTETITLTVAISDGEYTVQTEFSVEITNTQTQTVSPKEAQSSGGGLGLYALLYLFGLCTIRGKYLRALAKNSTSN